MRYGIFSDIHSNLEAFESVLDAYSKESIDSYLCIGDIVGYAANPKECINLFRNLSCKSALGNHDAAIAGLLDAIYFNPLAAEAIFWTKERLDNSDQELLKSFRYLYENESFVLVHGTLYNPERFDYLLNKSMAAQSFEVMQSHLCFVGHTHIPGVFDQHQGKIGYLCGKNIKLEDGKKYIVNVGSIGQPRDGDPRASYCVYDTELKIIEIKRVDYDIETAQKKIIQAGLPTRLASRLSQGS